MLEQAALRETEGVGAMLEEGALREVCGVGAMLEKAALGKIEGVVVAPNGPSFSPGGL